MSFSFTIPVYPFFFKEMHTKEEIEPLLGDGKHDNKSTDSREKEEIKLINPGQQITRNSESHEGQSPTASLKEDDAMTVQGMDANHKHKI